MKSPLLMPLLLQFPIPTSFPFPLPVAPFPSSPPSLPPLHLLSTLSPSPLPSSFCPIALLPTAPLPIFPSRCPLPVSISPLPPTPPHPHHSCPLSPPPLPTPLNTFGPRQPLRILFAIAPPPTGI